MNRNIAIDDYDKGVIELLAQLTEIKKEFIYREDFQKFVESLGATHYILVREIEEKIVGCATLFIEPKLIHNMSLVGHIEDVVVDEQFRGRGIGKKLIEDLTDIAKTLGCYKIILNCKPENAEFYRKCGFKAKELEMELRLK